MSDVQSNRSSVFQFSDSSHEGDVRFRERPVVSRSKKTSRFDNSKSLQCKQHIFCEGNNRGR